MTLSNSPLAPGVRTVVAKTREYLRQPAVVGYEQLFLDYLARDFASLGCQIDRQTKLLAVWRSEAQPQILSVHIDRHGLVGTGGGEYEYAAYVARQSEYQEDLSIGREMLEKIRDRFLGEEVVAYEAETGRSLGESVIREAQVCDRRAKLVFPIEGFEKFPPGTPVAFSPICQMEEGRISGQLDNAISAAVAYTLFAQGFMGTTLFTAEEEIGKSWTFALDYLMGKGRRSQDLLVLDTSPFPDDDAIQEGSVILRHRDANGEFNATLGSRIRKICEQEGIPFQVKDELLIASNREREKLGMMPLGLGSTELGRLVEGSSGALNGTTLQLPTLEYHSNRETTSHVAISNFLKLLDRVLEPQ